MTRLTNRRKWGLRIIGWLIIIATAFGTDEHEPLWFIFAMCNLWYIATLIMLPVDCDDNGGLSRGDVMSKFVDTEVLCNAIWKAARAHGVEDQFTSILGSWVCLERGHHGDESFEQDCINHLALIGWTRDTDPLAPPEIAR